MSDYDRYDEDVRDRSRRSRGRDRWDNDRSSGSAFAFDGERGPSRRDWDQDRSRREGNDRGRERSEGWRNEERGGSARERDRYGSDDFNRGLPMDETERLIASSKVEGTKVYGRDGNDLGVIQNFMVDKYSGRAEYAVLRHGGGFLGLDQSYYPIPWRMLTYDTRRDGYRVDLTEDELKERDSYDRNSRRQSRGQERHRDRGRY